jgi:DNA polymerase I-like protein with 3'-5' exonuclease and polymerase domains
MKKALIIMKKKLDDSQMQFAFMANVHDEVQIEFPPECADKIGAIMVDSIKESGVELGLKCPLTGEFKVGKNWSETH